MNKKVHTLVVLRKGEIYYTTTDESVVGLKNNLPRTMFGYLDNAVHYGQESFMQGKTDYMFLYCCWDVVK